MAEILAHGQQLDLRTRRGADFGLKLTLLTAPVDEGGVPIDITGASAVSVIEYIGEGTKQPAFAFSAVIDGPAGTITVLVPAGRTKDMQQEWRYQLGFMSAAGAVTPLIYGAFRVAQESL